MPARSLSLSVVSDEIARSLPVALEAAASWGLDRVELREGAAGRFPNFTPEEVAEVEGWRRGGRAVTAVSPGIFKGAAADTARQRRELDEVLPRTVELAARFGCPTVIVFGFERTPDDPPESRRLAMAAFVAAADLAAAAGLKVAIENEPNFWVDDPEASAALLREIGHPALGLNWDPGNMHWGGRLPTRADLLAVRDHLLNLHVKDYGEGRPQAPWWPVGEGQTPWPELVAGVYHDTDLPVLTLETHCEPLMASSRTSVTALRTLLVDAAASPPPDSPR